MIDLISILSEKFHYYAPLEIIDPTPSSCNSVSNPSSSYINLYYYDECTHSFLLNKQGYTIYEKNQFCKIKRIECDTTNNYIKDHYVDGYYKCRSKTREIEGYYFDSSAGFQKCDRSCSICKGPLELLDDDNCQRCNDSNGYYAFTNETSNYCLHKDEPKEHYYFDSQNKEFKKCSDECLTCNQYSNDLTEGVNTDSSKNTKCTKCDTSNNYFPQIDKSSNCIHKDRTGIKYYYFNSEYKRWEKCADGCIYCETYGTSIYDTKCKKIGIEFCDTGYYPVENDADGTTNQNCFKKGVRYDNYYFDVTAEIFKKCPTSCLQCDNNIICLSNKCNEKDGYFPVDGSTHICLNYPDNSNINYQNYYFDKNTKLFKKCHKACAQCIEQIDVTDDDTQYS